MTECALDELIHLCRTPVSTYPVSVLHDISTHQSVAEELIECTSLHRDRGETDGRRSLIIRRACAATSPATRGAARDPAGRHFVVRPGPRVLLQAGGRGGAQREREREMAGILAWFWNERFWLPHNVTWADLKNTDEATFPQAEDLYLACPLAFCIFMIRLVFERWVRAHTLHDSGGRCCVDGTMRRGCPPSACYLNNGILSGEPRKSPRLIVLPVCRPAAVRAVCS